MTDQHTEAERPPAALLQLAGAAIRALADGNTRDYATAVNTIAANYGSYGLQTAVMAWIDTLISHTVGHADTRSQLVRPAWQLIDDTGRNIGDPKDATETHPHFRWAGQLIAARANDDQATYTALLNVVPDDEQEQGLHITALANLVATNLKLAWLAPVNFSTPAGPGAETEPTETP